MRQTQNTNQSKPFETNETKWKHTFPAPIERSPEWFSVFWFSSERTNTESECVCVCAWHKRIETSTSGKSLPINWIKTARVELSFVFRLMSVSVEWLASVVAPLVDHAHYQNYWRINSQMCPLKPIDQRLIYAKHACNFSCVFIDNKHASAFDSNASDCDRVSSNVFFFLWAKFFEKKSWSDSYDFFFKTIFNSYANTTDSKALGNNENQTVVTIVALKMRNFFFLAEFRFASVHSRRLRWSEFFFLEKFRMEITSANVHTTDFPILRDTKYLLWKAKKAHSDTKGGRSVVLERKNV